MDHQDLEFINELAAGLESSKAAKAGSTRPETPSTSVARSTTVSGSHLGDSNAMYKELSTKLAWAVGSTFGLPYPRQSKVMKWATAVASVLVERYTRLSNSEKAGL